MKKIITVCILVLTCAALVSAQEDDIRQKVRDRMRQRGGAMGRQMMFMKEIMMLMRSPETLKEVGLTEEQINELKTIGEDMRESSMANREKRDELQNQLQEVLDQDTPDQAKAFELVEQMGQLDIEMQKSMVSLQLKYKVIVPKEQREAIKQKAEESMEKIHERFGQGGERFGQGGERFGQGERGAKFQRPTPGKKDGGKDADAAGGAAGGNAPPLF